MSVGRLKIMKVGAPVAVVLATVVNAASACDPATFTPKDNAAPDLSWAVNCGATRAHDARTLLARRAASTIQSLDRYFGAEPGYSHLRIVPVAPVQATIEAAVVLLPSQLHIESSHQHAAP